MTVAKMLYARYAGKAVLLDSNLLLVLLMGAFDPHLLGHFKRVSGYTVGDYRLLTNFMSSFAVLLTTPHILTEVSNLANSLPERIKSDWSRSFAAFLRAQDKTPGLRESWAPAEQLASTAFFRAFGITDAAIAALVGEALVITQDRRLAGALEKRGIWVLNFGDLRGLEQLLRQNPT